MTFKYNKIEIIALSKKGVKNKVNEDRYITNTLKNNSELLAVSDGMGGEPAGDVASELAISSIKKVEEIPDSNECDFLSEFLIKADEKIAAFSDNKPGCEGMGTTMTCVLIKKNTLYWAHVGDSRIYVNKNGNLMQITKDQTLGQFLLEEGEITEKELTSHYSSNILDQCLGHGEIEPETGSITLKKGDHILLSTDGIHKKLNNNKIEEILNSDKETLLKAEELITKSLEAGSNDDITLILVTI